MKQPDRSRALLERAVGVVIVIGCTIVVLRIMNPGMRLWPLWHGRLGALFADTTTNGGDMGAHVYWPWYLKEHWFPKGRLSGWSPDWYAGFPVGHYYFPLPAMLIALVDLLPGVPYNVAFKLVTVSGPMLLPASAYAFARGLRAPWPAPPAFAIAATGMLVQTRDDWQIYGGNIASTLAGEFSFTLALALGLFALGALGVTLDRGRRPWLPAVLLAASAMSHVVVAMVVCLFAVLIFVTRRPRRTWPLALAVGAVAVALTAVWSLPLIARHDMTQSMRYEKVVPAGDWRLWGWVRAVLPGAVERTIEGFVRGLGTATTSAGADVKQPLWLPWWIWLLAGIAILCAGRFRRRSTLVLLAGAVVLGVLFVQWPEHAVWNTRFLPFWLLTWGFLAAMGATELVRLVEAGVRRAVVWVRQGDLRDARGHAWIDLANQPGVHRDEAEQVVAARDWDRTPPGWEAPEGLRSTIVERRAFRVGAGVTAVLVVLVGVWAINRAWEARDDNPSIAIQSWARWNYTGYESKPAWPEYRDIFETMGKLPPGRALWEPSALGDSDPINSYGTSLALELLPYWTHGRIGSMEGLYFESSATTSFHFLTVSALAAHPSNPVRGLVYGTIDDFDRGVEHLQMLGVRYYMAWTPEAQAKAAANPALGLVATIPDHDGADPKGWKVYEVAGSDLVQGLPYEPVVAETHAGTTSSCFDDAPPPATGVRDPELGAWECTAARSFTSEALVGTPWAASGPAGWKRVDAADLADAPKKRLDPVRITDVDEGPSGISFHVDEVGVPVVVKESYFPNWEASGADGPYRLAPNLMVVVPREHDVKLTYGLTPVDWLGRIVSLAGIVGLVALARWKRAERYRAFRGGATRNDDDADSDRIAPAGADVSAGGDDPPQTRPPEPAPALP
jgi:6-pyruvoyl-tetrahydropterin synthase related domain